MLGWNFIWGYIFFHIMEVEIDINIFFEKISHFFQMSFFCWLPIFKNHILLFFCHKSQIQVPRDPRNLHLPPNPRWECDLRGIDLPGRLCVLTGSLRGFFNLAAGGAGLVVPFWILKGKVDGWLLTKKPLVSFVKKNPRNMVIEIQI